MITRILISCLTLTGCASAEFAGLTSFTIDSSCNLCIIEGELNGKKTYFILDTGAGITTFDTNQSKFFNFSYINSDEVVGGFTNQKANVQEAVGIRSIKISGMEVRAGEMYASNMDNLVAHIQRCCNKTISGIIGVPIIKGNNLVIDLPNGRLLRQN